MQPGWARQKRPSSFIAGWPRLPTFCKNKIGRRLLRGTKSIFDATRGRQGLMTVAETRCPRYYRLSPNFQA
jgi:hypothetical protein